MLKIKNRVLRVLAGLVALGVIFAVGVGLLHGIGYLLKLLCLRFFFVAHLVGSSCAGDPISLAIYFFLLPAVILYVAWGIGDMYFRPKT